MLLLLVLVSRAVLLLLLVLASQEIVVIVVGSGPVLSQNSPTTGPGFQDMVVRFHFVLLGP